MREADEPRTGLDRDGGFSLVEAVMAGLVLSLLAIVVANLLVSALGLVKDNTRRTVAANIAAEQIEKVRATRALDIADGRVSLPAVSLQGTTYQVVQDASYVQLGSTSSTCASSSNADLAYKLVRVTVTWPRMGSIKPVQSDTLRALGFGGDDLDATKGAAALQITGDQGRPVSGISVSIRVSGSGSVLRVLVSDADGCVVFSGLTAGNYVGSVDQSGYVDPSGAQASTSSVLGVNPQQVSKAAISYDVVGALVATLTSAASYPVPASLPLTLTTSQWSQPSSRVFPSCPGGVAQGCVSGSPARSAVALFPAQYGVWAGSCADSMQPTVPVTVAVSGGTSASYTVQVRDVGISAPGITTTVYAVHARESAGCGAGAVINLGTPTAGTLRAALPFGTWKISTVATVPSASAAGGTPGWAVLTPGMTPYPVIAITS